MSTLGDDSQRIARVGDIQVGVDIRRGLDRSMAGEMLGEFQFPVSRTMSVIAVWRAERIV